MNRPIPDFSPAAERVLEQARRLFLLRDLRSVAAGADRLSFRHWAEGVRGYPQAAEANEDLGGILGGEPVRDAFFLVTSPAPQLVQQPPQGTELLHRILGEAITTPGFGRLRETAGDDPVVAAYGAAHWAQELVSQLPESVKEAAREAAAAQRELQEAQEVLQQLAALNASLEEEGREVPGELVEQLVQAQAAVQAATARAQAASSATLALLEERAAEVRAAASRAAEAASAQGREFEASVRGFDLAAGGEGAVAPEAARAWMEVLARHPRLQALARELGWARRLVGSLWRQSPHARTELVGYHSGYLRAEELAPWELALMVGPAPARLDFLRRAAEGDIRHRQLRGREKMGRGPLVVIRDESGSMQGGPHALAVAIEWALLEVCRREGRPLVSICFSGPGQVRAWRAPTGGRPDHEGLLRHLSHFYGGGTEPYQALSLALREVEESPEMRRADILLVSDAIFPPPPEEVRRRLEAARRRRPLHLAAVLVGTAPGPLEGLAYPIVRVSDLLQERERLREALAAVL